MLEPNESASQTPNEEALDSDLDAEIEAETGTETPDVAKLSADFKKALAQKKHWREKALAAEAALSKSPSAASVSAKGTPTWDDVDTVGLESKGHSTEEIQVIAKFAKAEGKRMRDVVQDQHVKDYIAFMRSKNKTTQATPSPSAKAAPSSATSATTSPQGMREDHKASFVNALEKAKQSRTRMSTA